jgi:hypothetical protein
MTRLVVLEDPSPFEIVEGRERELWKRVNKMSIAELSRGPILSANAKTGTSLNLSTTLVCSSATETCKKLCYSLKPTVMTSDLMRRLRNTALVCKAPKDYAGDLILRRFAALQRRYLLERNTNLDFLRVCGVGDLILPLVEVVNYMAHQRPDIILWLVSRKFDIAGQVTDRPNVFVSLSTDATTQAGDLAVACELAQRPNFYLNYLRLSPDDPGIPDARIVYDLHEGFPQPWSGTQCPVDAGTLKKGNVRGRGGTACARCRLCFLANNGCD